VCLQMNYRWTNKPTVVRLNSRAKLKISGHNPSYYHTTSTLYTCWVLDCNGKSNIWLMHWQKQWPRWDSDGFSKLLSELLRMAKNCTEYRHFVYEIPILVKWVWHTNVHTSTYVTIRRLKIYDLLRAQKFANYLLLLLPLSLLSINMKLLIAARIHTTVKSTIRAH